MSGLSERLVRRRLDQLGARGVSLDHGGRVTRHSADADGSSPVIRVLDDRFFRDVVLGGGLGFAESYLDGRWDTPDLTALLTVLAKNLNVAHEHDKGIARLRGPARRLGSFVRRNTKIGSKRNIAAHYDLGNDFFALFLDETMTYSCGYFPDEETSLLDASLNKLDRICQKLGLTPEDHVLETGTGWGSFAIHAAKHYGCRVTTTTISGEQYELARQRVDDAGLSDRIELLKTDYRDLRGSYDKVVSIEMIEAVGHNYLGTYLGACSRLLKPDGQMLLQVISMPDQRYGEYLKTADFIQKHVFPGSCCPSISAVLEAATRGSDLRLTQHEDMTSHYVTTLSRWSDAFEARLTDVRAQGYPERFIRLWRYYLSYCIAGFSERSVGVGQMVLSKPVCRASVDLSGLEPFRAGASRESAAC